MTTSLKEICQLSFHDETILLNVLSPASRKELQYNVKFHETPVPHSTLTYKVVVYKGGKKEIIKETNHLSLAIQSYNSI